MKFILKITLLFLVMCKLLSCSLSPVWGDRFGVYTVSKETKLEQDLQLLSILKIIGNTPQITKDPTPFTFEENWDDGSWNDTWVSDITSGDNVSIVGSPVVSGQALRISDNADWAYFDGLHYEFSLPYQPSQISFYIRKTSDRWCQPRLSFGDDNTNTTGGAIDFSYTDNNDMVVNGSGSFNYASVTVYHQIEFRNINFTSQTLDFYVDNTLLASNVAFQNPTMSITRIYIHVGWYFQAAYIDNMTMVGILP